MADNPTKRRRPRGQSRKGISGRLWESISPEPNSGCWLWTAASNAYGYGVLYVNGRNQLAHRASYELSVGPIPDGLELDHLCRVPACVNPSHLEPVTHVENMRRGVPGVRSGELQRAKTHCPNGHPYSQDNIYYRSNGHRDCKTCSQNRSREYQRKKRSLPMSQDEIDQRRTYWRERARANRASRKTPQV